MRPSGGATFPTFKGWIHAFQLTAPEGVCGPKSTRQNPPHHSLIMADLHLGGGAGCNMGTVGVAYIVF
jgi:hypothetical protein